MNKSFKKDKMMLKDINSRMFLACSISFILFFSPKIAFSQKNDGFAGSKACGMCHSGVKKLHAAHGHSKMLRPVEDAKAPAGIEVNLPDGMAWKDISYLTGGYKYYARFIDSKGYVVTGPKAQWSMVGKTFTPFKPEIPPGTLKYECVKCHTVGWKASGTYENGVNNSLEGIPGVWFENGVGCESCHGPGQEHIALQSKRDANDTKGDKKIVRDTKSELCGTCHKRTNDGSIIIVANDMLESRQQYTELMKSKKAKFTCVTCHEPHMTSAGFIPGSSAPAIKQCESCHTGKLKKDIKIKAMSFLKCENCHMPLAARGAFDSMVKGYHKGDTHSHLFGITTDTAYKLNDGTNHAAFNKDGYARLTVEMVCYSCHKAGIAHDMPREEMLEIAKKIH